MLRTEILRDIFSQVDMKNKGRIDLRQFIRGIIHVADDADRTVFQSMIIQLVNNIFEPKQLWKKGGREGPVTLPPLISL